MKVINLLPKTKQKELQYEITFRRLIRFAEMALATALLVFIAQLLVTFSLQHRAGSLTTEIQQTKQNADKTENARLREQVKQVNSQISDFKKLQDSIPNWSGVLEAFAADIPEGVVINSFNAAADKRTVSILGQAGTREAVIQLYNNIVGDKEHFSDMDYPLENVSKPENITFHFSFTINDSVLKPE